MSELVIVPFTEEHNWGLCSLNDTSEYLNLFLHGKTMLCVRNAPENKAIRSSLLEASCLGQSFPTGDDSPPRGHLAMSGDFTDFHNRMRVTVTSAEWPGLILPSYTAQDSSRDRALSGLDNRVKKRGPDSSPQTLQRLPEAVVESNLETQTIQI